jgi:hypothetical protein
VYDAAAQLQARQEMLRRAGTTRPLARDPAWVHEAGREGLPVAARSPVQGVFTHDAETLSAGQLADIKAQLVTLNELRSREFDGMAADGAKHNLSEWLASQALDSSVEDLLRGIPASGPATAREASDSGTDGEHEDKGKESELEEAALDVDYPGSGEGGEEAYQQGFEVGRRDARYLRDYEASYDADAYEGDDADAYTEGYDHGYGAESSLTVMRSGEYVSQDDRVGRAGEDEGRTFNYIGIRLAYTFWLSECTALAMYDPVTQLSFLAHNDSTNEHMLAGAVEDYFNNVSARRDKGGAVNMFHEIVTRLYAGLQAEKHPSSVDTIRGALKAALANMKGGRAIMDNLQVIPGLSQGDVVAVGNKEEPRVAPAAIKGVSRVDLAINSILLGRHLAGDERVVTILENVGEDVASLVGDVDELRDTVAELKGKPESFQTEMAAEIAALEALVDEVESRAGEP